MTLQCHNASSGRAFHSDTYVLFPNDSSTATCPAWFLVGGSVKGGLYHGAAGWPSSLIDVNLDSGRYIRATVEFRDIFGDVLTKHFGTTAAELGAVLPGHTYSPVGLFT